MRAVDAPDPNVSNSGIVMSPAADAAKTLLAGQGQRERLVKGRIFVANIYRQLARMVPDAAGMQDIVRRSIGAQNNISGLASLSRRLLLAVLVLPWRPLPPRRGRCKSKLHAATLCKTKERADAPQRIRHNERL